MQILWKRSHKDEYTEAELFPLRVLRVSRKDNALVYDCINEQLDAGTTYKESTLFKYAEEIRGNKIQLILLYVNPVTNELVEKSWLVTTRVIIDALSNAEEEYAAGQMPIFRLKYNLYG